MEKWLAIPGFPGYLVSDQGRVRSLERAVLKFNPKVGAVVPHRRAGRDMKSHLARGYPRLVLCINGKAHREFVHRLVLLAFVGAAPEGTEARHLNGDRSDARLDNLAWGSKIENAADRKTHGTEREGSRHAMSKLRETDVLKISSIQRPWPRGTIARLAREHGVSIYAIWRIKAGLGWRCLIS